MNLRILIVDDSRTTRRVLSALVNSRWTVCGVAENGKSALKKFRELNPDLVLLDLGLPDIDGLEVAVRCTPSSPTFRSYFLRCPTRGAWKARRTTRESAGSSRSLRPGSSWIVSSRPCPNPRFPLLQRRRSHEPNRNRRHSRREPAAQLPLAWSHEATVHLDRLHDSVA